MTVNDLREIAYTSVVSHASSPCGRLLVFGTNMGRLLIYLLSPQYHDSSFEAKPIESITLEYPKGWHALSTAGNFLFCGFGDQLACYKWTTDGKKILTFLNRTPVSPISSHFGGTSITRVLYHTEMNQLYVCDSAGSVHVYAIGSDVIPLHKFTAHNSTIHSISSAGSKQFVTSSEDGLVRFWDCRTIGHSDQCTSSFQPHNEPVLARPRLGNWLTTVACDPSDYDWFVTGGGPRLALWNRRVGKYVVPLVPDTPEEWYPQTSLFSLPGEDVRIMAGGNSGRLFRWDHAGCLVSSLALTEPPRARLSHVIVADSLRIPTEESSTNPTSTSSVIVAAGAGPAIRLVSMLGYPLGILSLR